MYIKLLTMVSLFFTKLILYNFQFVASYVTHDEYRMEKQDPPPITERVEPNLVGVGHDLLQVVQFFKGMSFK